MLPRMFVFCGKVWCHLLAFSEKMLEVRGNGEQRSQRCFSDLFCGLGDIITGWSSLGGNGEFHKVTQSYSLLFTVT